MPQTLRSTQTAHRLPRHAGRLSLLSLALLLACSKPDHFAQGQQSLSKGEYATAVVELKNAAQAQPDSLEVRIALADALERTGDTLGAEHQLRQALKSTPKDELVPRIALLMLDRMDVAKLDQEFHDRKLSTPAANSELHAVLALGHLALQHPDKAREELKDVTPSPTASLAKAQLLLADGQREKALAELEAVNAQGPANWWVLRATSRVQSSLGQREQALKTIQKAHEAAPWNRGLIGEYGEALLNAGRIEEATAQRDKLRKQAPGYFWTQYLNAALMARAGRYEEAHASALKVLAGVPDHLPATLIAASAELQKGETLMAEKRLLSIGKKHPNSIQRIQLLAQSYLRSGRLNDANDMIRNGLALDAENKQLLSLKADVALQRRDARLATQALEALLKSDPKDAYSLLRMAELQGGKSEATLGLLQRAAEATTDQGLQDRIIATVLRLGKPAEARKFAEDMVKAQPEQAQTRLSLAAVLRAQGDADGARKQVQTVLDKNPAYAPALSALELLASNEAQRAELLTRYAQAVKTKGSPAQTFMAYAAQLERAGQTDPSPLSVLEQGLSQFPDDIQLRDTVVEAYLLAGKPEKAISTAESGASANNAPATAVALLATTYQRLGKQSPALEAWRKAVAASPLRNDWKLQLAEMEAGANRHNEAASLLRSLLTSHPTDARAYRALALLVAKDKPSEAISVAKQMGQQEKLKNEALLLEGEVLLRQGKLDDALKQYSEAVKAGAIPAAAIARISVLDQAKRQPAAESELATLLRNLPKHPGVLQFAAQRAMANGQVEASLDYWKRAVELAPNNGALLNDYAWALVQSKKPGAVEVAQQAVAMTGNHPNAMDTLALALAQAGKQEAATKLLRSAFNLAPTVPSIRLHLASALNASGDKAGAAELIKNLRPEQLNADDKAALSRLRGA
ncbi:PEP-CTERM system TPR-repeat protein PrsT [Paucibacter sp. APW11]|uniref:PEP-CTERM system TPR-repeat protein PrsT n=1 Tax=Roseateles aquae TaxID=3077235 RepID=A0ABU3PHB5_9BURK|nr:XrtA/PEP-CTERM system TPR-repeat protein PrsT [Paucibacter sp. APW11]MDT9001958.1 PEP-CTERM system TPR-repeat protein PrsT [Paucibacter sp. APW11]